MCYTGEEIAKFIEILKSPSPKSSNKVSYKYCYCSDFFDSIRVLPLLKLCCYSGSCSWSL